MPLSIVKIARRPPPSSSLPRRPKREPDRPPDCTRVSVLAPLAACT
jgi:hypothetical protein